METGKAYFSGVIDKVLELKRTNPVVFWVVCVLLIFVFGLGLYLIFKSMRAPNTVELEKESAYKEGFGDALKEELKKDSEDINEYRRVQSADKKRLQEVYTRIKVGADEYRKKQEQLAKEKEWEKLDREAGKASGKGEENQ